jgi:catalase (peroxidase I)
MLGRGVMRYCHAIGSIHVHALYIDHYRRSQTHAGFEGSWSTTPTKWSNEYFKNLLEYTWELKKSPAGKHQWQPKKSEA